MIRSYLAPASSYLQQHPRHREGVSHRLYLGQTVGLSSTCGITGDRSRHYHSRCRTPMKVANLIDIPSLAEANV
jgi:hypothetical protein